MTKITVSVSSSFCQLTSAASRIPETMTTATFCSRENEGHLLSESGSARWSPRQNLGESFWTRSFDMLIADVVGVVCLYLGVSSQPCFLLVESEQENGAFVLLFHQQQSQQIHSYISRQLQSPTDPQLCHNEASQNTQQLLYFLPAHKDSAWTLFSIFISGGGSVTNSRLH